MAYPSALDVEIANDALARLSEAPIGSFGDNTTQARIVNRLYPRVRALMFSSYDWKFATARAVLVPGGVAVPPWAYEYALPDNVARTRMVQATRPGIDLRALGPREYEEGVSVALDGITVQRVIRCDVNPAVLDYTYEIIDPSVWDGGFLSCFTMQLAAELAMPITANGQLANAMAQAAQRAIASQMGPGQVQSVVQQQRGARTTSARDGG